ncbi:MAG TPA: GH25 family lysozyme [Actinocrinis sp.]|nr:GH25 family lysozyme [Actinocrinis sp.]
MTIYGPDISSYEAGLDLSQLADASFVIAKTTEGTYYTDADYQGWRLQAARLGKPFAWYHFLSGENVTAQAAHTMANVGDASLPGMLDFEPAGAFRPTVGQGLAYVDAAHAAGLRLVLLYLPRWYHQELGSPDLTGFAARGVHLVSSAYPGGTGSAPALYPGDGAAGWQPYGGMAPVLYQFTNQASDGGKPMDYNAFRGSVAELQALFGGNVILGHDDIAAIAAAVNAYRDTNNEIQVNGKPYAASAYELAVGTWKAVNDPAGGVEQTRGQVNNLFHRPVFDAGAFAAAVTPVIQAAVAAGLPADEIAQKIAEAVPGHIELTVSAK